MRTAITVIALISCLAVNEFFGLDSPTLLQAQSPENLNATESEYDLTKQPDLNCEKLTTGEWWKKKNKILNVDVDRDQVIAFALYTHDRGTLKLTAQLYPLYPKESSDVTLEFKRDDIGKGQ